MDSELACYGNKEIVKIVNILNDCVWCTNLFVTECYLEEKVRKQGICNWKRKKLFSKDDVYKELSYIELLLEKLINLIKTEHGERYDLVLIENLIKQSNDSDHGHSDDCLRTLNIEEEEENEDDVGKESDEEKVEESDELKTNARINASVVIHILNEINWRDDVCSKQNEINEKIKIANSLLEFLVRDGVLNEQIRAMAEFLVKRRNEISADVQLTGATRNKCGKCWNPCRVHNVDSLLFEKEKWRIEVLRRNGGDPLEHLCGIALPLQYESFKSDTRATYYGIKRKNLLSISLQTADMSEKISRTLFRKLYSLFLLLLSFGLYFSDMVSDLILAGEHFYQKNTHYGVLTLIVVFGPLIAETLSKLILKVLGWDKDYGKLKWKDVFNCNDLKIAKWMACSIKYSLNGMRDYRAFGRCYEELQSHRCSKGKQEHLGTWHEEEDSTYIHTVFRSMLAWNERFILQTWLAESLNESAPQLLLQLTIVLPDLLKGNDIGSTTWICIVTSILSFSWSIHLSHFNRHYREGGRILNNTYTRKGRTMEFIGNCFVYGSRFTAICLMVTGLGWMAVVGFIVYLAAIYVVMIICSARKEIYKTLHRYKTTIFWPLHRMFTVPYRIGIWRMDSVDHLLFYLEIICMAVSLPFLMPAEVGSKVSWIITGSVLLCEAIGIALLYLFKRFFHPYGYVCENR